MCNSLLSAMKTSKVNGVLLVSLLFVCIQVNASSVPNYHVKSCNLAPYPIDLHWVLPGTNRFGSVPLSAGECSTIKPSIEHKKNNSNIRLYAEPQVSTSFNYLENESWYVNMWRSDTESASSQPIDPHQDRLYCSHSKNTLPRRVSSYSQCDESSKLHLYSGQLHFNDTGRADWLIVDTQICKKLDDIDCFNITSLEEAMTWANEMNLALQRLSFLDNSYGRAGLIPTHMGIEVRDTNRMFNEGVAITSALKQTPFGTPIQLQTGDEILLFNGNKVFGRDLQVLVYEAGKEFGYNHAHNVVFRRNGEVFSVKAALFFDPGIYGTAFQNDNGTCRAPLLTAALSALNEFMFYKQTTATCLYDGLRENQYSSFDECKFERDQFLAAGKQFCPKVEYTGALVGGLSFAGRSFVESAATRMFPSIGKKNLYSRVTRAALLEVSEESVRAVLTQPPGLNTEAVMNDIVERGKLQGAIGVGFQVVPKLTMAALVPIVYQSYQDL